MLGKDAVLDYILPMRRRRHRRVPTSLTHNLIDLVNEERNQAANRSLHERVAEKMTNFAGTGTLTFTPEPTSDTARADTVKVTFVNIAV